jgi:Lon protease-like protein
VTEIGLFPLSLVLLPTERVPLHIFEERYQELIGECLKNEAEFGLVYADDDGIRDIGTRAGVVEVLDRFDDGRMNILIEGRERFRLLELTSGRSFQTGAVRPVADTDERPSERIVERALALFGRLRDLTGSEVDVPSATTEQLSYALASRVELDPTIKLDLLANVSERERLERVCELLEAAAVTVERQRIAAERAMTNGRVHLG